MQFVLLQDGLWAASPNWSRSLVSYTCPSVYCNCTGSPNDETLEGCALHFYDSDSICTEHRVGILCGKCEPPYGVGMLSLRCREFTAETNMYYWLMPLLVLFVVFAVVIIVKVGVVIPSFCLGYLFYIQTSSIAVAFFSQPFQLQTDVMSCVSSVLALYVPYDFSVHSNFTALEAYGLRYIPPVIAIIVAPITICIKFHSRSWNGIWTLLLLMYGMMVETVSSLLFCPTFNKIKDVGSRETITVWFYDGSVECYRNGHLGLVISAIFFLLLTILILPLIIIVAYYKELSSKFAFLEHRSIEKIYLSLTSPYHPHTRWWLPLELTKRLLFIMSIILCPGYLSLPLLEAGVLVALVLFVQPYQSKWANIAESFSLILLVFLLILGNNNSLVDVGRDKKKGLILWPIFYLPLAVATLSVSAYYGWKLWLWIKQSQVKSSYQLWKNERKEDKSEQENGRASRLGTELEDVRQRKKVVLTTVVSVDD